MRAVAVYLVVLFHAQVDRATGGFIGVDVFFVLSGFLVTQLLLRDVEGQGRIRFGRFYARRFRRLLPASAVTLVATAILYKALAEPGQAVAAAGAFKAAFLYVANWHLIDQATGYFGADAKSSPVVHFWSLAIEEQFYLLWPLLLAGLFAVTRGARNQMRVVRTVIVVLTVASLARALLLQGDDLDRAYYGTDTRFYQLSLGGLLALTPGLVSLARRSGRLVAHLGAIALAGVLVLSSSLFGVGAITRGAITAVLVVVLLAALEAAPTGWVHRALGSPALVYLGRISYGTYLWHWPVILVALSLAEPNPLALSVLSAVVATGLAGLSSQLMEMPIRLSPLLHRHRYAVIGASLAISVVGALVVIPQVLDTSTEAEAAPVPVGPGSKFTPLPAGLDLELIYQQRFGATVRCIDAAPSDCTVVNGAGRHVLLMGDSNAAMLVPAFGAVARSEGLTLSLAVTQGCPWQRNLAPPPPHPGQPCQDHKEDAYKRVIPALDPDIIVLVNVEYDLLPFPRTREATMASLRQLRAPGRTILLVEPIVEAPYRPQPLECLEEATFVEDCRYVADDTPSEVELLYRSIAANDQSIVATDLDRLACPYLPICDPIIGGLVVRWNAGHLATAYSASLGDDLVAYFRANRLLSDTP